MPSAPNSLRARVSPQVADRLAVQGFALESNSPDFIEYTRVLNEDPTNPLTLTIAVDAPYPDEPTYWPVRTEVFQGVVALEAKGFYDFHTTDTLDDALMHGLHEACRMANASPELRQAPQPETPVVVEFAVNPASVRAGQAAVEVVLGKRGGGVHSYDIEVALDKQGKVAGFAVENSQALTSLIQAIGKSGLQPEWVVARIEAAVAPELAKVKAQARGTGR
jgi:hypothetical protein